MSGRSESGGFDGVLAPSVRIPRVALAVSSTLVVVSSVDDLRYSRGDLWLAAVLVLGCAAVVTVGLRPLLGAALAWLMVLIGWGTGSVAEVLLPLWLTTVLGQVTLARRFAVVHAVVAVGGLVALVVRGTSFSTAAAFWGSVIFIATGVALGEAARGAVQARTRLRLVEAARVREAEAQANAVSRARDEERSAVARSLHDVVAGHLTIIATTVAAAKTSDGPQTWREALDVVDGATETALVEMRELLHVLDQAQGSDGPVPTVRPATRAALPPSERILHLVGTITRLGREVVLDVDAAAVDAAGEPAGSAIVRVVREALTNAVRYAGDGPVQVSGRIEGGYLVIRVRTPPAPHGDAPAPGSRGTGRGLAGLATTVRDAGGVLDAGPDEQGAWVVVARVPRPAGAAPAT